MFKRTKVCASLAIAFGGVFVFGAPGVYAQGSQRIEITGSAIKRTDAETPVPVEIITRKDIERIGSTTINELLKSISSIDIQDAGEISSNSPGGSGTARVRMRGLGDTQTLVLVNGRRMPVNPLADASGAGAAFNVNQLPISAIERIEILKDGGSAIYGADAVAGVVNFILRRDYGGIQATFVAGQSSRSDAKETGFNAVVGFGNLASDRFNVMAAVDVVNRDPFLRADRELSRSVDYRRFGPIPGFNLDGRSSFAPQGNILNPNGSFTGLTVRPCPPADFTNNACRYDFNGSLLTAYNGADRISGLLSGTAQVTSDISAFVRVMAYEAKDHLEAHPVPDNFTLPDGRRYAGRFMQGGPRITDKKTTFGAVDIGLDGSVGSIDFKVGLSKAESKATNQDQNYFDRAAYNAATQSRQIDPTVLTNDPAVINGIKISPVRKGTAEYEQLDGQISGDLFTLPGGALRYAAGLVMSKETLGDQPDPRQIAGTVVGSIQQSAVAADRDAKAAYVEFQIPVTKSIEGQLAARYDKYDTASRTSPKLALSWKVMPEVKLRGSYSESFKMPTLKQLFANAGQGAINLTESQCVGVGLPAGCAGQSAFRLTGSNPALGPELGKTYNLGVVAETGPVQMAVDFWMIDKSDNITTPTLDSAIAGGAFTFDQTLARYVIFQNLQNFSAARNTGVDFDAKLQIKGTPFGNVSFGGSTTYYFKQMTRTTATSPWAEFNGTYNTPRWRATGSVQVDSGAWSVSGLIRGTGGYYDTIQPWSNFSVLPAGGLRKVGSYDEIDMTLAYTGIKNLRIAGSVKNLFDQMPPFSATNATNNNFSQQGFAELYTTRGRFFQITGSYTFR